MGRENKRGTVPVDRFVLVETEPVFHQRFVKVVLYFVNQQVKPIESSATDYLVLNKIGV